MRPPRVLSGLVQRVRGRWRLALVALLRATLTLGGVLWAVRAPWWRAAPVERETATFVGRQACASCHAEQDRLWRGSDHDLAMQVADEQSMLGDFGDPTFTHRGITTRFFRRDGKFFARTEGPDGRLQDFPIAYAFGVRPLQQYLIALPGGRYQALGIAWDTRPRAGGGQRWFALDPGERLYHADGQILGEVYEYGSFLQSKMYRAGVTCSDCHDPHSLRVAQPTSGACARCHAPAKFDTSAHHHHRAGTPGASCIECHMPTRTYMVVDPRRDHSLRVPRPDLSVKLGTPDSCTGCHRDRTPRWAAEALARWYGPGPRPAHYGEAIHAGRRGLPGADAQLLRLVADR
jgi:hypothetical protein